MTYKGSRDIHDPDDSLGLLYNIKVFLVSAGLLGIMFLIIQWLVNGQPLNGSINPQLPQQTSLKNQHTPPTPSQGERIFLTSSALKNKGAAAVAAGDYGAAVTAFKAARQEDASDPEALIYLNNARIGADAAHELAVIIPAAANPALATSLLRGVAQAQTEINQADGIQGKPLRLILGDDQGDNKLATAIATQLSESPDLVGVIGHSHAAATEIYQKQNLSLISINPATKPGPFVHPMFPESSTVARALAEYITQLNYRTVTLFYDSTSDDSFGFKASFETTYKGDTVEQIDLANLPEKITQKSPQTEVTLLSLGERSPKAGTETILNSSATGRLFGGHDLFSPEVLDHLETIANSTILAVPEDLYQSPASPFSDRPLKLWETVVDIHTTVSYNAAQTVISGLKQVPSREGVNQTLETVDNSPIRLLKVSINDDAATGYELMPIGFLMAGDTDQLTP